MKVVAAYSVKGGVGKTSAAVNFAALCAEAGWRVLLWDLDPQGAATYLFRVKPKVRGGATGLVSGRRALVDAIRATNVPNLDLVPADIRYRRLDIVLNDDEDPTGRIAQLTRPLAAEYDWVFLDCAPSISLVSEGVFEAADALLVPLIPSALSVRTLDQLEDFLREARSSDGRVPPQVLAFFSMTDLRRRLHREIIAALPERHAGRVASTAIPSSSLVERMGAERAPIFTFAPKAPAAQAYRTLWAELEARLDRS